MVDFETRVFAGTPVTFAKIPGDPAKFVPLQYSLMPFPVRPFVFFLIKVYSPKIPCDICRNIGTKDGERSAAWSETGRRAGFHQRLGIIFDRRPTTTAATTKTAGRSIAAGRRFVCSWRSASAAVRATTDELGIHREVHRGGCSGKRGAGESRRVARSARRRHSATASAERSTAAVQLESRLRAEHRPVVHRAQYAPGRLVL